MSQKKTTPTELRARVASARVRGLTAAAPEEELERLADPDSSINVQDVSKTLDDARDKYVSGKTQPRDNRGKFRKILARLRQNLGASGLQDVTDKIQAIENMDFAGNYLAADRSAGKLVGMVDRIDAGALNARSLENVRESAKMLGQVIANTPLPFGDENAKLKFSDLPPSMKNLAKNMASRIEGKFTRDDDGAQATEKLKKFMSGSDMLNQGEVQGLFSTLLRLLT